VEEEGELLELPSEELASCNFKRFCRCVASRTAYDVASLQGRNFALGDAAQVECRTRGMSRSSSNHAVCGGSRCVLFYHMTEFFTNIIHIIYDINFVSPCI